MWGVSYGIIWGRAAHQTFMLIFFVAGRHLLREHQPANPARRGIRKQPIKKTGQEKNATIGSCFSSRTWTTAPRSAGTSTATSPPRSPKSPQARALSAGLARKNILRLPQIIVLKNKYFFFLRQAVAGSGVQRRRPHRRQQGRRGRGKHQLGVRGGRKLEDNCHSQNDCTVFVVF